MTRRPEPADLRRPSRGGRFRQAAEGIGLVVAIAAVTVSVGALLALVVAWIY